MAEPTSALQRKDGQFTIFICTAADIDYGYGLGWYESEWQLRQWELEQDLAIEQELGRWPSMQPDTEETEVEHVDAAVAMEVHGAMSDLR